MTHVRATPTGSALGAFVDLSSLPTPLDLQAVFRDPSFRDALDEHLLLIFRGTGLELSEHDLLALARQLGDVHVYFHEMLHSSADIPEMKVISNRVAGNVGGNVELEWHTNIAYEPRTALYTILYAEQVPDPSLGGSTYWADLRRAWEELPAHLAARVESLEIYRRHKGYVVDTESDTFASRDEPLPEAHHPIVKTHPRTGRRALFEVGDNFFVGIVGLDPSDSASLISVLREHALDPRFVYRHEWQRGDLVVWDGLSTMHKRDAFDPHSTHVVRVFDVLEPVASGKVPAA